MKGHLVTLAFFVAVAAVWSWPAPLLQADAIPGLHFDQWPTLWLLDRAPHIGLDLHHAGSNWPLGESLTRLDSWVLLGLAWLLRPLLAATTLFGLVAWLGPALSAFAAERCASVLGATRPASLLAGLAYGFSGIAASAALEGHVAHLFDPWLPLLLAAGWGAGGSDGRPLHAVLAGLFAALALLTTAYHGLCAALLLVALTLRSRKLLFALLPLMPVVAWLAWLYSGAQAEQVDPRRVAELATLGSASLSTLLTWTAEVDLSHHSVGAPIGALALGGLLLGWRRGQRPLLALALLALLLSLGPTLRLSPDHEGVPSPLFWLWSTPLGPVLRFPVRFAWLTALCGGLLAATAATRAPRLAPVLVVLGLLDVFVSTGLPGRQATQPLPPDHADPTGPVLDLFPVAAWPAQADIEMRTRTTSCAAQITHAQPTLTRCIGTTVSDPRTTVAAWLLPQLMRPAGPPPDLGRRLAAVGVATLQLHAEHFRASDAALLTSALTTALGPPVAEQRFTVPQPEPDPAQAAQALDRLVPGAPSPGR